MDVLHPSNGEQQNDTYLVWALLGVLILACFVRLYSLAAVGLWIDEFHLLHFSAYVPVTQFFEQYFFEQNDHVLFFYYSLCWIIFSIIDPSNELVVRLLSLSAGITTILCAYVLLQRTHSRALAFYFSALLSFSWFHIRYSLDGRPYALVILFSVISFVFFLENLTVNNRTTNYRLAVSNFLLILCHQAAIAFVLLQLPFLLLARFSGTKSIVRNCIDSVGAHIFSFLLAVCASLKPILMAITKEGGLGWIQTESILRLRQLYVSFLRFGDYGSEYVVLCGVVCVCALAALNLRKNHAYLELFQNNAHRLSILYAFICAFILPSAVWLLSLLHPIFVPRYFAFSIVPLFFFGALALSLLPRSLGFTIVGVIALSALVHSLGEGHFTRQDSQFEEAALLIADSEVPVLYQSLYAEDILAFYERKLGTSVRERLISVSGASMNTPEQFLLVVNKYEPQRPAVDLAGFCEKHPLEGFESGSPALFSVVCDGRAKSLPH